MKKETLIDLLQAETNKTSRLLAMQIYIEDWQFEIAMHYQFEYLYWHDEWCRLYKEFAIEYWNLKCAAGE